jgi:AcrR family transcriptional regulator
LYQYANCHTVPNYDDEMSVDDLAPGLRERKKVATEESILREAFALFDAEGYDAVTVERIAEAADVSLRTVYRYFPTKAAIVFEVQVAWMRVFRSIARDQVADETVLAHMRRVAVGVAAYVAARPADAQLAHRLAEGSPELQAMSLSWERDWRIAVADLAGSWQRDQAAVFAGMAMGMISATLGLWLRDGATGDLVAMIDRGVDQLEQGWATAP